MRLYFMNKGFIILLSIIMIVVTFSSCNSMSEDTPKDTVNTETTYLPDESLTEDIPKDTVNTETTYLPDESLTENMYTDYFPSIESYAFSTIDDFKLFCTTGSRDSTLYNSPPKNNAFPPYNMYEGCFVDMTRLFPGLDKNSVTIDHIEISSSGRYSYSGYTNIGKTPFSISIKYENKSSNISVESVVADSNASLYKQIIRADYYDTANKASSTEGAVLYVFELNKCIVKYNVYKGKIQGMAIRSGDYEIGLSPGYSDNDAFFTDEALKPLSCLFSDSEDRVEALNRVVAFTISD